MSNQPDSPDSPPAAGRSSFSLRAVASSHMRKCERVQEERLARRGSEVTLSCCVHTDDSVCHQSAVVREENKAALFLQTTCSLTLV